MPPRVPLLQHAFLPEILTRELEKHYDLVDYAALTPAERETRAEEFTVLLTNGEDTVDRALIASLPRLELVADFGVGFDGIDLVAARDHGVAVSNTPGVLTEDVSDLAIALMFAVARQIPDAQRFIAAGGWQRGAYEWTTKVSGSRLGIVGLGRIGAAVARKASGFDMGIAYTDRSAKSASPYRFVPSLTELARQSQFLVVCTPGGAETAALIDTSVLDALGPDGYLINIARGTVVDQEALAEAVMEGRIGGAALDVFAHEPDVPEALLGKPNVVVTPHMASATWATRREMARLVRVNVDAWLERRELVTPVPLE